LNAVAEDGMNFSFIQEQLNSGAVNGWQVIAMFGLAAIVAVIFCRWVA
jgi:hypothetical protein